MPARKITQSHSSLTGKVISAKNNAAKLYESSLEKDLIYCLEFDYNVQNYEEQPVTIEYFDEAGKKRRYTPDFLVNYWKDKTPGVSFKSTIIEVKYRKDLWKNWKLLKPKFTAAMKYADVRGWKFKIMTEVEIRTQFQQNARFLLRYIKREVDKDKMRHLLDLISEFETSTPRELILAASVSPRMQGYYLHTVWYLIANGFIKCDLTRAISTDSEIWVNEGLR